MSNPLKPYLGGITDKIQICIPAKFVNDIKNGKFWYCKRCYEQVSSRNENHCNDRLNELEIFEIEKLSLHEISEREASKIFNFNNRKQLINFIEMYYGDIKCNEPLSIISIKRNP